MITRQIDEALLSNEGLVPAPVPLTDSPPVELHQEEHQESEATQESAAPIEATQEPIAAQSAPETNEVDDYGNPVEKKDKLYTKTEVQEMIRDRLSRVKQPEPQAPITYSEPQHEANSEQPWEQQLEQFNESWYQRRQQREQQEQWQHQEQEAQAQFEIKFNEGASKYGDFESVVIGKPLTPQMVLATRGMNDPAAFIYAAAKTQAPELDRISKIHDPMIQAVELGKLEERMRKTQIKTTNAPKPLVSPAGDVSQTKKRTWSIDDKLRQAEQDLRKLRNQR